MKNKKKNLDKNEFSEKKQQVKHEKYKQRLKQMQDVVEFIKIVQSGIESLEAVIANVLKSNQKKEQAMKLIIEKVTQLEKQLQKKDKKLADQDIFISEFNLQSSLHVCV